MRNYIGCELLNGWKINCNSKLIGGISELYLIKRTNISNLGYSFDDDEKITFISYINSTKFYKFDIIKEVATYDNKEVEDDRTGLIYWNSEFKFQLAPNHAKARKQLLQMLKTPLIAVWKDNNGRYWLEGKEKGCIINASITMGKLYSDTNAEQLTLTAFENKPMYEVVASAVTYYLSSVISIPSPTGDLQSSTGID